MRKNSNIKILIKLNNISNNKTINIQYPISNIQMVCIDKALAWLTESQDGAFTILMWEYQKMI